MHKEGNSYIKIAQWMNEQGHLTTRGSVFKPNYAWSIHMKKQKTINRFAKTYEPSISNIGIDIMPYPVAPSLCEPWQSWFWNSI